MDTKFDNFHEIIRENEKNPGNHRKLTVVLILIQRNRTRTVKFEVTGESQSKTLPPQYSN